MTVNRSTIWGRKTITAPTPRMTPSAARRVSAVSGSVARTRSASPSIVPERKSIAGVAQVKMAWKKKATKVRKTARPTTG